MVFDLFVAFVVQAGGGCVKSGVLLVLALAAAVPSIDAQNKPDAAAATTRLADDFVAANLERFPEQATFYGAPDARNDRVFDNTVEAKRACDTRGWGAQSD